MALMTLKKLASGLLFLSLQSLVHTTLLAYCLGRHRDRNCVPGGAPWSTKTHSVAKVIVALWDRSPLRTIAASLHSWGCDFNKVIWRWQVDSRGRTAEVPTPMRRWSQSCTSAQQLARVCLALDRSACRAPSELTCPVGKNVQQKGEMTGYAHRLAARARPTAKQRH